MREAGDGADAVQKGRGIYCGGNLRSRFIQSSRINAQGDVIAGGEVMDTIIETNGTVLASPGGKLLGSTIKAMKGVAADQIGSESSRPCLLTIGVVPAGDKVIEWKMKMSSLD